jgi:hypothetical protein
MTPEEILAWEAEHRQRAGIAALLAAAFTFLGVVLTTVGQPSSGKFDNKILTVLDTMSNTAAGRENPPGQFAAYAIEVGKSPGVPIVGAVVYGLGSMAIFFAIAFIFRATRARRPELQQLPLIMAAIGAVAYGAGRAVAEVARYVGAAGFVDAADHSNSAARDALSPTAGLIGGQIILPLGALALGFAFVLICLNAMRVGLLTRFMGVLGLIVGVTFVLPLDQQGIIRIFWLGALGFLILGRWPNVPKAWATGQAEPWPTQQQLREQRAAARAGREPGAPATEPRPERKPPAAPPPTPPRPRRPDPTAAAEPHSSSKKKKRKRRS